MSNVATLVFKQEDTLPNGTPIGPVYVKRDGKLEPFEMRVVDGNPTAVWFTDNKAMELAKREGLLFLEV